MLPANGRQTVDGDTSPSFKTMNEEAAAEEEADNIHEEVKEGRVYCWK